MLWARVLQAVPDSRLLVKCAAFCEPEAGDIYRQYFAEQGISPDRLDFEGPSNFADAMRAYDRIDIALDTVPYNGGTTTCHALWMGVPVVSLKGGNFCGRMGASFLAAAGFPGLVAADQRGFVDIAANLATDSAGLDNLKAAILERLPNSPTMRHRRLRRRLACALQTPGGKINHPTIDQTEGRALTIPDNGRKEMTMRTTPLHDRFGVEVHGANLCNVTAETGYLEIRAAFEAHSLLLFRNQDLDDARHLALAPCLGRSRTERVVPTGRNLKYPPSRTCATTMRSHRKTITWFSI